VGDRARRPLATFEHEGAHNLDEKLAGPGKVLRRVGGKGGAEADGCRCRPGRTRCRGRLSLRPPLSRSFLGEMTIRLSVAVGPFLAGTAAEWSQLTVKGRRRNRVEGGWRTRRRWPCRRCAAGGMLGDLNDVNGRRRCAAGAGPSIGLLIEQLVESSPPGAVFGRGVWPPWSDGDPMGVCLAS